MPDRTTKPTMDRAADTSEDRSAISASIDRTPEPVCRGGRASLLQFASLPAKALKSMRLSRYHLPTLKEVPSDAEIISHKLLLRAGMIRKLAAGIYAWLPLGLRVLKKVENVV